MTIKILEGPAGNGPDPRGAHRHEPDAINTWDGGRGVYFEDQGGTHPT